MEMDVAIKTRVIYLYLYTGFKLNKQHAKHPSKLHKYVFTHTESLSNDAFETRSVSNVLLLLL